MLASRRSLASDAELAIRSLDPDDRTGQRADDAINRLDSCDDELTEGVDIFSFDEYHHVVRARYRFG